MHDRDREVYSINDFHVVTKEKPFMKKLVR